MADSVATRLRQARGDLTVTDVARRSGIPESRIRTYEEGIRQPYGKTLVKLAEAYGIPIAELVATPSPSVTPAARSRRRRRRLPEVSNHHVIEVPVDIRDDAPIRLTIELVLRPRRVHAEPPANGAHPEPRASAPQMVSVDLNAMNPLAAFRQAYDDFRKDKRS
jgi:transcriptional regulator with XRE-family HTH domain